MSCKLDKLSFHVKEKGGVIMVTFTNITFDNEWIYADAYDSESKKSGKIKISIITGEFWSDFEDINNQVHKAALYLKRDAKKGKLKQNSTKAIAWG